MPAMRIGVPEPRHTVNRDLVTQAIDRSLKTFIVLTAPSGYGKTIAAAQYSASSGRNTIWIRLQGGCPDRDLLLPMLLSVTDRELPSSPADRDGLVVAARSRLASLSADSFELVLDDYGGKSAHSLVEALRGLINCLQPFVSKVIVTSRTLECPETSDREIEWIAREDLAFEPCEIQMLSASVGCPIDFEDAEALKQATHGYPALARIFVSHRQFAGQAGERPADVSMKGVIAQLIGEHVPSGLVPALETCAMLRECSLHELGQLGYENEAPLLIALAGELPLLVLDRRVNGAAVIVHDLIAEHMLEPKAISREAMARILEVVAVLALRRDWQRLMDLVLLLGSDLHRRMAVEEHGEAMLADSRADVLLTLLSSTSLNHIMDSPRALLVWSQALRAIGHIEDEQAKARAAARVAAHHGDADTTCVAVAIQMLAATEQGRIAEALSLEASLHPVHWVNARSQTRVEVLYRRAYALMALGQADEALGALNEAGRLSQGGTADAVGHRLERAQCVTRFLRDGDVTRLVREHTLMLTGSISAFDRALVKGNLAGGVVEMGRLDRAESLLHGVADSDNQVLRATYMPTLGLVKAARGDYAEAIRLISLGAAAATDLGYEGDLNQHLTFQACIERAGFSAEAALISAERSFEVLSAMGWFGYACLAAAEIAASLLLLGDVAHADQWLDTAQRLVQRNSYYAITVDAIRATLIYRRGFQADAVHLLRRHAAFIRREAANWRLAMYCRTFPELLGLLGMALGPEHLPAHMLRMVLPENAETALRTARSFMPEREWRLLGERVLGSEQFADFLERKGKPICRVRLFGGLEVTVGDRVVRERDWTKRKGRLLFTILVSEKGREVARDQLLEHLWPDLTEAKAKNNFYVAWSTMKSALMAPDERSQECPYVESARGRCRVLAEKVRSDLIDFDELQRKARAAEAEGRPRDAIAAYADMMTIYRGDLLPGDIYDDWFATLRDGYRRQFVDGMLRAVEILLELDDPCEAVLFARRGLTIDPTREDLYQAALRSHIAAGQRSSAIDTFIQCKTQLAEEFGLDPSAETLKLYQEILVMEERPRYHSYEQQVDPIEAA